MTSMNGLKLQRGDSVGHLGEICEALQQSLRKLLKKKKSRSFRKLSDASQPGLILLCTGEWNRRLRPLSN